MSRLEDEIGSNPPVERQEVNTQEGVSEASKAASDFEDGAASPDASSPAGVDTAEARPSLEGSVPAPDEPLQKEEVKPSEGAAGAGTFAPALEEPHVAVENADIQRMLALLTEISASLESLAARRAEIERKILDDFSRQEIINRLHSELQEARRGQLDQATRPLIMDLIALHDTLGRRAEAELARAKSENGDAGQAGRLVKAMRDFQDEVEVMLFRQSVMAYTESSKLYVASRQRALSAQPAPLPELENHIRESLRKGFERNGEVIRPEIVNVYGSYTQQRPQEANNG